MEKFNQRSEIFSIFSHVCQLFIESYFEGIIQ